MPSQGTTALISARLQTRRDLDPGQLPLLLAACMKDGLQMIDKLTRWTSDEFSNKVIRQLCFWIPLRPRKWILISLCNFVSRQPWIIDPIYNCLPLALPTLCWKTYLSVQNANTGSFAMQAPAQNISKVAKSQPAKRFPRSAAFQAAPFAEAETTLVTFWEAEAFPGTIDELAALSARAVGDALVVKEGLSVIKKPCSLYDFTAVAAPAGWVMITGNPCWLYDVTTSYPPSPGEPCFQN